LAHVDYPLFTSGTWVSNISTWHLLRRADLYATDAMLRHADGTPLGQPAPAIIAETEQARRARQFGEFRSAVEAACPAGCLVVVDMLHGSSNSHALAILTSGKRRAEETFMCHGERWATCLDRTPERWMRDTVEAWDRDDGRARREGGK
jgi:hypothetical protein